MTDLLSPEQLNARARFRRERLTDQAGQEGVSEWPIVVEGWSGERQVFGIMVTDRDDLRGAVSVARSAFNVDTVVVFSDSRMFSLDQKNPDDQKVFESYQRGEATLLDLAKRGDPRVVDLLMILPFSIEHGASTPQTIRYLTRYAFGREVGLVWDIDNDKPAMSMDSLKGRIPEALKWAMQDNGMGTDGQPIKAGDGAELMWEQLDAHRLLGVGNLLDQVTGGRFVILNAHPKITEAAGLAPGSAPGRIVAGNRSPEVVMQLVARETKTPAP